MAVIDAVSQFIQARGITYCDPAPARGTDWYKPTASGYPTRDIIPYADRTPPSCFKALAQAVLLTAVQDLGGRIYGENTTCSQTQVQHHAHKFFFTPNADFDFWCAMAGMHPDYVRRKARNILDTGLPVIRALPGKSLRYFERKAYRERHSK